ncbi:transmembrane protein [Cystoisospora suis]|uniref:Golgi apparatus membrane protein TVP23 homolog n=1 Tax=Cystoisospora suis TaxID=483139 RepID=A0A2C6KM60_9APIC|nr:transmembrane protein [Cystoisospora suis]
MISLDGPPPATLNASSFPGREGLSFMSTSTATPGSSSNENSTSLGSGPIGGYVPPSVTGPSPVSSAETFVQRWFAGAKHPTVCFFHLFFKAASLAVYITGNCLLLFISEGEIFIFVATLILLALDFWTVKNVSGRILVGMRWWSCVDEDGNSQWMFERAEDGREVNPVEWRVFWFGTYAWVVVWLVLAIMTLAELQLFWFLLCAVGIALAMTNLMAYRRCSASSGESNLTNSGAGSSKTVGAAAQGIRDWLASQASAAAVQGVLGRVGLSRG